MDDEKGKKTARSTFRRSVPVVLFHDGHTNTLVPDRCVWGMNAAIRVQSMVFFFLQTAVGMFPVIRGSWTPMSTWFALVSSPRPSRAVDPDSLDDGDLVWVRRQVYVGGRQRVVDACIYCRETSIQVGRLVFDDILEVPECVLAAMKLVNTTMPPVGLVSGMGR